MKWFAITLSLIAAIIAFITSIVLFNFEHSGANTCNNSLDLLIGIMSSRINFEKRNAIRQTWLKNATFSDCPSTIRPVFIVGDESCRFHPEDRLDPNSCDFWNVQPPLKKLYHSCEIFSNSKFEKLVKWGFTFKVQHSIVVYKLGLLTGVLSLNDTIVITLLNAATNEVIVEATFSSSFRNISAINGYHYLIVEPYILPKGFEATLVVDGMDGNIIKFYEQTLWNFGEGVILFKQQMSNDHTVKWTVDTLSATSFAFEVYEVDSLRQHVNSHPIRQKEWNDSVKEESDQLKKEMKNFNDILLVETVDVYSNLPFKLLQFYKWAWKNYRVQFVMKTDDDVVIDVKRILEALKNVKLNHPIQKLWWSRFRFNWVVNKVGKWAELDYRAAIYPPFACGLGNILSVDIVEWLVKNANDLHAYQGEDVSLGIWLAAIAPNYLNDLRWQCDSGCTNDSFNVGQLTANEMITTWNVLQQCSNLCGYGN